MQKSTEEWLKVIDKRISANKEEIKRKKRAALKFNSKYVLQNDLRVPIPFDFFTSIKDLKTLKANLLLFHILYSCHAFSTDFFKRAPEKQKILMKLSDFRLLAGYKAEIPKYFKRYKQYLVLDLKPSTPLYFILQRLNCDRARIDNLKTVQYKPFSFLVLIEFLNTFKTPSISFLLYLLNLYKFSNSPKIQFNLKNLCSKTEITLKQGKQKAVDRLNKYLDFLFQHDIIADAELKPLSVQDFASTESLNIRLNSF